MHGRSLGPTAGFRHISYRNKYVARNHMMLLEWKASVAGDTGMEVVSAWPSAVNMSR